METNKTPKIIPTTFQGWVKQTFTWVDNDVKRYMQRAWTASTNARDVLDKQETKALKQQNEECRAMLKEIAEDYQREANEYVMMNVDEPAKFWQEKSDKITELLTKYQK